MDLKELRLGNLVYQVAELGEAISRPKIVKWDESHWYRIGECLLCDDDFEPIPMRVWTLLKFRCHGLEMLSIDPDGYFVIFNSNKVYIKYAHQLQNFYFAIYGEELEVVSTKSTPHDPPPESAAE